MLLIDRNEAETPEDGRLLYQRVSSDDEQRLTAGELFRCRLAVSSAETPRHQHGVDSQRL